MRARSKILPILHVPIKSNQHNVIHTFVRLHAVTLQETMNIRRQAKVVADHVCILVVFRTTRVISLCERVDRRHRGAARIGNRLGGNLLPLMTFAEKGTISVPGSDMVT